MYPVAYEADYVEKQGRLSTFFRYLLAIPWMFVAIFWGLGAYVCLVLAWFAIVFTGRYPQGLYDFVAKASRFNARVNGWLYLMTDRYPPFDGDEHPEYPIRLVIPAAQPSYSRVKALLRAILAIPVMVVAYLLGILAGIVVILSWIVIVITGKHPKGLFDVLKMGLAYMSRASVYYCLITETYPPISADDGAAAGPAQPAASSPFGER